MSGGFFDTVLDILNNFMEKAVEAENKRLDKEIKKYDRELKRLEREEEEN